MNQEDFERKGIYLGKHIEAEGSEVRPPVEDGSRNTSSELFCYRAML